MTFCFAIAVTSDESVSNPVHQISRRLRSEDDAESRRLLSIFCSVSLCFITSRLEDAALSPFRFAGLVFIPDGLHPMRATRCFVV